MSYYDVCTECVDTVDQGRSTRGPRATSGPPKVSKWTVKGFYIARLIDSYLRFGKHHKIHRNWWTEDLFFRLHLFFCKRNRSNLSEDLFFGLHVVFGKRNQSNLSGNLFFFGEHHKIHRKTLPKLNFGSQKFWNSKFGP